MIHLTAHNYNAREIIQNIFSPLVGVICSPQANEVCARNNLTFVEMLQPFARLLNDAHFRDVSDTSVSIKGLRLNFCDVDWRPPQTVLARKMLNEAVTNAQNEKTKFIPIGKMELELPTAEPWFDNWRETFLTVQFPADHEFTRHFLSCLIVLSSGDPNIIESAHKLTQRVHQMQSVAPQKLPKWFHPSNVLNSYVVLHEGNQGDISKAQQGYELLKSTFGDSKCFLVQINSLDGTVTGEVPDYWAPYIKRQTRTDLQNDQLSGPKTPQDALSITSMPTMQLSILSEALASENNEAPILHPLSPVQENATEAISSKFSVSSESIASQTINTNVWPTESESDAVGHGGALNAMDVENLRHFVQDYSVRALIPYAEHLVSILAEAITNKKGVSKSLLSATKRWFVSSKPGSSSVNQNAVIYESESSELQTRKLGDLYFMFNHYNLAFQAYHQAKRDFNADSAWQFYAGALEMAAVAAFMLGTANRKTYDYMEDAIMCYLTVCKLPQFATRATLLSMECLKTSRMYGEAAKQLIRMTSEDSDLRSALLLEQAAYCFLASNPSMYRKYAFNIVLSGNRYSRAGQRKHAYRCYQQAFNVFQARGWSLAEDHIQYTMAKQAYGLKKLEEASRSYSRLLHPASQQSSHQQLSFLKEYIQTHTELIKRSPEVGLLPLALPQVAQNSIRVLLATPPPIVHPQHVPANGIDIKSDLSDEPLWQKMEEMLASTASTKTFVFKPSRFLFNKEHPAIDYPLAIQGEPIEISVTVFNTVKCDITINGIDLLWKLNLDNGEMLSNESLYTNNEESSSKAAVNAAIKSTSVQSVVLNDRGEKTVYFKITPKLTGLLNIIGMVCEVVLTTEPAASLLGMLQFETAQVKSKGKQSTQVVSWDNKLSIKILPAVPSLAVSFSTLPTDLVAGEILPVTISLRNSGIVPIEDIFLCCDNPRWITLMETSAEVPLAILKTVEDLSNKKLSKDKEVRRQRVFRLLKRDTAVSLKPQESTSLTLYIQAPYRKGNFTLRLLFYYGLPDGTAANVKYRLVRHSWNFLVYECLHSEVTCVVSNTLSTELGLDVNVKNASSSQHFGVSEIFISTLGLYNADYKLNTNKLYMTNQMEIATGRNGDRCLQIGKSANFQCRLEKNTSTQATIPAAAVLRHRLSFIDIMPPRATAIAQAHSTIPPIHEMYSFLAKHETVFLSTNINTEEFNNAATNQDAHTTVVLNWTANLQTHANEKETRTAVGQHFIQLRNLYECTTCLGVQKQYSYADLETSTHQTRNIAEFALREQLQPFAIFADENQSDDEESDDATSYWEANNDYVGRRCLLLDESVSLTVKA